MKTKLFGLLVTFVIILFYNSCMQTNNSNNSSDEIFPIGKEAAEEACKKYQYKNGYLFPDKIDYLAVYNVLAYNGFTTNKPLSGYIKTEDNEYTLTSAFVKKNETKNNIFYIYLDYINGVSKTSITIDKGPNIIISRVFQENNFTSSIKEIYFEF